MTQQSSAAGQPAKSRGDNRTPDKTIGQVKYADNEGGGEEGQQAGSTRTSLPSDQKRAQQSQNEGPAAYAPHADEPASGDEARKREHNVKDEEDR